MPDKPPELQVLEREVLDQGPGYMAIQVDDEDALAYAAGALQQIRAFLKRAEEIRKSLVKPLNDHVKWINEQFAKATDPMKSADTYVSGQIQQYRTMVEAARVKEQKRLQDLADKRKDRADAAGRPSPIPEAIAPIVEGGPRVVTTDDGQMQFMKVRKWEITDADSIPREYLIPDSAAISKLVKAGLKDGVIPGIRVWSEEVPVIRGGNG